MTSPERGGSPPAAESPDTRLAREYRDKYYSTQAKILKSFGDEKAREAWAVEHAKTFHDLAASDPEFHDLLIAPEPDIPEILRRIAAREASGKSGEPKTGLK